MRGRLQLLSSVGHVGFNPRTARSLSSSFVMNDIGTDLSDLSHLGKIATLWETYKALNWLICITHKLLAHFYAQMTWLFSKHH